MKPESGFSAFCCATAFSWMRFINSNIKPQTKIKSEVDIFRKKLIHKKISEENLTNLKGWTWSPLLLGWFAWPFSSHDEREQLPRETLPKFKKKKKKDKAKIPKIFSKISFLAFLVTLRSESSRMKRCFWNSARPAFLCSRKFWKNGISWK